MFSGIGIGQMDNTTPDTGPLLDPGTRPKLLGNEQDDVSGCGSAW